MRVLCVDDHDLNRQVIKEMLDVAGLTVEEAPEADTGLTMIDTRDYDLVLMDLRMPGKDGLTALREIRARGDSKGKIPVLVVTGDTGMKIMDDVDAAGGDALLFKPVMMDTLFDAIGRTLAAVNEKRVVLL
ncbi:MAG: response regulator [Alphaproteobacteria bacterium PA2]|nr:MAG: response regulator [Alphaproteobacteria bacterium PA2]